jgi:Zn-dependent M28 family amino/carboxypeptidase
MSLTPECEPLTTSSRFPAAAGCYRLPLAAGLLLTALTVLGTVTTAHGDGDAETDLALPPGAVEAAGNIGAGSLAGPVRFLASDLLEGRGPASRGDRLTQAYLASQLEFLGLEPAAADGGWLQPFDVVGVTAELPESWSFQGPAETSETFRVSRDWMAFSGVQEPRASLDGAEVVFVGYGIQAPEYGWDDFKGVDLTGKVLLMLNNDPDWDPQLFGGTTRLYYGRWTYKYESAARQGAAGAIVIHTTPSAGYPWQVVDTSWSGTQFELPAAGEPRIQVGGWLTEEASRRLAALGGRDLDRLTEAAQSRDFHPVPLGVTTSLALTNRIERVQTANVLGLLPGSDPQLADEVVVYTAHHDHLGVGHEKDGDAIYNGALDNAAGVAQVLAIAKSATALPQAPRRSLLFLFVAAEEQGLLGSEYYAHHPTFPPGKIAANINYDGGNIWGATRDVTLIGMGKSSLDAVARKVAASQGRTLTADQFPDKGYYYRSDQFNFAKIGVPALYFDNGTDFIGRPAGWGKETLDAWTEVHYHQPSDEITPEWTFEGMIQDARLGFYAGLLIADADALPVWSSGDEFEAARKAALAAVGR